MDHIPWNPSHFCEELDNGLIIAHPRLVEAEIPIFDGWDVVERVDRQVLRLEDGICCRDLSRENPPPSCFLPPRGRIS